MKHPQIRAAVLAELQRDIPGEITWFDGRPAAIEPDELPAVAVYLTEAEATSVELDADIWSAVLHIEVFLKAEATDTALDQWMEDYIYPAMSDVPALDALIETINAYGYDYQRDDVMATWGSADLKYNITYEM